MKDRRTKANRAQADYFELLVAQYICHLYKIRFSYSKDLATLSNKILTVPDGANRLKLQNKNFLKLTPKLKNILSYEISEKGIIIEVTWIGRKLTIKTPSDVDAEHITHKFTRFSIKSIAESGLGTIKNLGMRSLKEYLGIDFAPNYKRMWQELRSFVKKPEFDFFNFILDAEDKDLYVIIANSKGAIVYKPNSKKLKSISKTEARKGLAVGYIIYINNIPTYRIQTNATNGIGISPFCQRVFFVDTNQ